MPDTPQEHTELIPVDAITVVNPRVRNQKVFDEIVANIAELGLKRQSPLQPARMKTTVIRHTSWFAAKADWKPSRR